MFVLVKFSKGKYILNYCFYFRVWSVLEKTNRKWLSLSWQANHFRELQLKILQIECIHPKLNLFIINPFLDFFKISKWILIKVNFLLLIFFLALSKENSEQFQVRVLSKYFQLLRNPWEYPVIFLNKKTKWISNIVYK